LPEFKTVKMPVLELARWYSQHVLGKTLNQAAHDGEQAFLFLDEVQNLPDWAPQLKHLVDTQPVRVLVTGSSALRIEAGRDSLAGRISTFEMGPLLLREIAELRGFGQIAPMLPSNGLAPLKDKSFWKGW
jgi:predicted AAA+ superfamily ATPase